MAQVRHKLSDQNLRDIRDHPKADYKLRDLAARTLDERNTAKVRVKQIGR